MADNTSILPSVIILKNSIIEGRIPLNTDLEVGELALQLHKGEENIYAKNSEGEIVSLREPKADLMWGNFFKKYESLEEFQQDLEEGNIEDTSIVFIKDGEQNQIWTDGTYYASPYTEDELDEIIGNRIVNIPAEVYSLSNESSSQDISSAFGGEEKFSEIINKVVDSSCISGMTLPGGGTVPVSLIPKITSLTESELRLEWISNGNYTIEIVRLNSGVFTVQKNIIDFSTYSDLQKKVDNIYNFNKELVNPVIKGTWTIYTQEEVQDSTKEDKNIIIEEGFKVKFSGTFSWNSEENKKNPEAVSGNWSALPGDGIESSAYNSDFLTTDTTISVKLSAPRTGLIVENNNVVLASGNDYTQDQVTLKFVPAKSYWGVITKGTGFVENDIIHLAHSSIKITKDLTVNSVSCDSDEYYVYAYPQELGDLTQITQDGVSPIIEAFTKTTMEVTNSAGVKVMMNIYATNNPGAFTGAGLKFN